MVISLQDLDMAFDTPYKVTRLFIRRLRSSQSPLVITQKTQIFSWFCCLFCFLSEMCSHPFKCTMQSPILCFSKKHTFNCYYMYAWKEWPRLPEPMSQLAAWDPAMGRYNRNCNIFSWSNEILMKDHYVSKPAPANLLNVLGLRWASLTETPLDRIEVIHLTVLIHKSDLSAFPEVFCWQSHAKKKEY